MEELIRWVFIILVFVPIYYFLFFRGKGYNKLKFNWKEEMTYVIVTFAFYILLIIIAGLTRLSNDLIWTLAFLVILSILIYRNKNKIKKFMKKK